MKYIYIETTAELESLLFNYEQAKQNIIALDTEGDNNRYSYGERLCLIQVFDGNQGILIDPMKIDEKTIRSFLETRNILKVMYDASNDYSLIKRTYCIEIQSILDLKPAVDLLDYKERDLYSILAQELGVILTGKHEYQRYNWMIRPIPEKARDYALNDVLHLLNLKEILLKKIFENKLLDQFILRNLHVQNKEFTLDLESKYKKVTGYSGLTTNEKVIFQKIYDIRDEYAEMYNLPGYRIIRNDDMIHIAKDIKYLNRIQFPIQLSLDGIRSLLKELKSATDING